jgi:hypothetical protein
MDFLQFERKASKRAAFVFAMAAKVDRIGKDSPVQELAQDKYLLQYLVSFIENPVHKPVVAESCVQVYPVPPCVSFRSHYRRTEGSSWNNHLQSISLHYFQ